MRELKVLPLRKNSMYLLTAAAQIPMMRELKVLPIPQRKDPFYAAAQIPMMRELKVSGSGTKRSMMLGCSPNPYDEGTERRNLFSTSSISNSLQPKSL